MRLSWQCGCGASGRRDSSEAGWKDRECARECAPSSSPSFTAKHVPSAVPCRHCPLPIPCPISLSSCRPPLFLSCLTTTVRLGEMQPAALVRQIIAVDAGEDDIVKPPVCHCLGCILRLLWVEGRRGLGGLDGAETAATRTGVAHQHYSRSSRVPITASPAVPDVGTPEDGRREVKRLGKTICWKAGTGARGFPNRRERTLAARTCFALCALCSVAIGG